MESLAEDAESVKGSCKMIILILQILLTVRQQKIITE